MNTPEKVTICVQLYDPEGHGCGAFYKECATFTELIQFLQGVLSIVIIACIMGGKDDISDNGYYTYEIGIDELERRKN